MLVKNEYHRVIDVTACSLVDVLEKLPVSFLTLKMQVPLKCSYTSTKLHSIMPHNLKCVRKPHLTRELRFALFLLVHLLILQYAKHWNMSWISKVFESCSFSLMSALYNKICLFSVPQNAWFCIYFQITRVCGTTHLDQKLCYTVLLCVVLMWYDFMMKLKVMVL